MSKLLCPCGHIIFDQTDNLPYKGYMVPDSEMDGIYEAFENSIDSLIEAIQTNTKPDWIKRNFQVPPYPTNLKESSMIHDILMFKLYESTRHIFECENCGRILIQMKNTNRYKCYYPETTDKNGIFNNQQLQNT